MRRATSSTREPLPPPPPADAQAGDPPPLRQDQAGRLHVGPLSLYFKGPRVKVEIGLCKGKKLYDKREAAAKKDAKREMDRALKLQRR